MSWLLSSARPGEANRGWELPPPFPSIGLFTLCWWTRSGYNVVKQHGRFSFYLQGFTSSIEIASRNVKEADNIGSLISLERNVPIPVVIPVCEMAFWKREGNEKNTQTSGTGSEWKNIFLWFGNWNLRLSFPGMDGKKKSRSPLLLWYEHFECTRPKPAYGRQGLAGLWGQETFRNIPSWTI